MALPFIEYRIVDPDLADKEGNSITTIFLQISNFIKKFIYF